MVFIPFRLRNQKWDTYHLSGTQLWLDRDASWFAPNPCRKPPNTDTSGQVAHLDEVVQRGERLAVQRGLFALARGNILLTIAVRAS